MKAYRCLKCNNISQRVKGFIPTKNDRSFPQPDGWGCSCIDPLFTIVQTRGKPPVGDMSKQEKKYYGVNKEHKLLQRNLIALTKIVRDHLKPDLENPKKKRQRY